MKYNVELEGEYVVEVIDVQETSLTTWEETSENEQPIVKKKELISFKHWEDAVEYMLTVPYIRREAYSSESETDDKIVRMEYDEGGTTYFILHKWPEFEKCRDVEYTIKHGSEQWKVHSKNECMSILNSALGEGCHIYWKDGYPGCFGWAERSDGTVDYDWEITREEKWKYGEEYLKEYKNCLDKRKGHKYSPVESDLRR